MVRRHKLLWRFYQAQQFQEGISYYMKTGCPSKKLQLSIVKHQNIIILSLVLQNFTAKITLKKITQPWILNLIQTVSSYTLSVCVFTTFLALSGDKESDNTIKYNLFVRRGGFLMIAWINNVRRWYKVEKMVK